MLLDREKSCLLLVDMQEKLMTNILHADRLIERCQWLMRLASELDTPLIVSEQYSKGLGSTIEPLRKFMPGKAEIDKIHFSCYRDMTFVKQWQALNKKQLIIMGIETHVCVLQTALDAIDAGVETFVVVDAVGSRHELDHHYALKRMKQAGAQLITGEMIFFEWLKQAGTPSFKALSQAFLR